MADKELIFAVMNDMGYVLYVCSESEYDRYFGDVPSRHKPPFTSFRTEKDANTFMKLQNERVEKRLGK